MVEDATAYRVDGEIGRITFACHQVTREGSVALDTSREVFPALTGKEWYRTVGFKELAIVHGALRGSYRQTARRLNRARHQPGATPLRTLQDSVEAEGLAAAEALEQEAQRTLREGGLDDKTLLPVQAQPACAAQHLDPADVDAALRELAPDEQTLEAMRTNPVRYEEPSATVNVSIDDVLAKKQKEHRPRQERAVADPPDFQASKEPPAEEQKRKYVYTTVAHVEVGAQRRVFASAGLMSTCLLVVAFLVANKKLRSSWVFFVDGQRTLQDTILGVFAWQGTMQIILDWYHVVKKCKESLSLALNNRHVRNAALKELMPLLWYGNLDAAIAYLRKIEPKHVKAADALERLVGYLERNRSHIPCYAARKKLGLRNSSNRGEKANDLVVSARQKHNGMSWSQGGSSALATLSALVSNDNHRQWFEERTVDFRLAA
jgi:hypothetical protein